MLCWWHLDSSRGLWGLELRQFWVLPKAWQMTAVNEMIHDLLIKNATQADIPSSLSSCLYVLKLEMLLSRNWTAPLEALPCSNEASLGS